ncbi:hypothetical protein BFL38_10590 [Brachyspira hampsonii]|uniref:Uncharacterized protein n=1 Tax=Brachyspira hampsonii TaxID=1287055 RepID=A0A1E5NIK2_9SPIR|nr:hypothetical protein [Brachyspira hampsonii]OEJ15897.1 hypothetical protein BFL38_10590 [Brachyspira hampsonii]
MRELNFIEDNGLFGITFKSDNKSEANTIMNAIQRFISKNSDNEIKENINDNSKSSVKDYSRCPIDGPSKDVYLNLFSDDKLIELYNSEELEQGHKDYIKNELNKRGIFDLSMTKSKKKSSNNNNTKKEKKSNTIIENIKEHELNNKIKSIKNGRDITQLSNEELEEIALLESELASICGYSETAKHILQGKKFNHSRELENKITQGRRLSELTLEELKELEKVTMLDNYREDIQKEIYKRENKSFEETLKENNEIISFSEDEEQSNYKIDEDEDPLSVDTDNINNWDFDADGDKVDADGNKMLFDY